MHFRADIQNYLLLLFFIANFVLCLYVFSKGKTKKTNIFYSLLTLGTSLWTLGWIMYRSTLSQELGLFWVKFFYVGAGLTPISLLFFALYFPEEKLRISYIKQFLLGIFGLFFVFIPFYPNFIVRHVELHETIENRMVFGFGVVPWGFYLLLYMAFAVGVLIYKHTKLTGVAKLQIRYILLGTSISYLLGFFTNHLLPTIFDNQNFAWLGPCATFFMIAFIAYAIFKHRLMGIIVFVSKIYIVLIITAYLYTIYQLFVFVYNTLFLGNLSTFQYIAVQFMFSLFAAATILPFINYIQKSSDYLFFRGQNHSRIMKLLSTKLSGIIDIRQVISIIDSELKKIVGADDIRIVYTSKKSKNNLLITENQVELYVAKKSGLKKESIPSSNEIFSHIIKHKSVIVQSEIQHSKGNMKLLKELKRYNAQIVAPMIARKKIIGAIILGQKVTQNAYTKEDIDFIEIISSQAAIAIDNARLYKEIKDFNTRLKQEVARATKNLQSTNDELKTVNEKLVVAYEKLHKLDRAKSEFLSIASHQLRTPLTSIKGFTSLVLEGTYGKISNEVRKVLEKVFLSNERLIRLVEDLLNITRIESGKFVFELKKQDITSLVEEVIESFSVPAKSKDIEINLKIKGRKSPKFYFDKNKIREVLSNFIDNSLKYSEKGPIDVEISNQREIIRVAVSDKGLGIPKGELEYIFDKFQRGKGVNQVHTEGVGLGLYVCKKIIEAHKGKIWAESDGLGRGSSFIFELQKKVTPKDLAK